MLLESAFIHGCLWLTSGLILAKQVVCRLNYLPGPTFGSSAYVVYNGYGWRKETIDFAISTLYWGAYKANIVSGLVVGTRNAAVNKVSGVYWLNGGADTRPVHGKNVLTM